MSKKWMTSICFISVCSLLAAFWWLGQINGLYLAGQQDALRDNWIQSNAAVHKKCAYLTFDDGPSDNTDEILDILKEEHIKATFFVVAKNGNRSKQRYQRIAKEGHTLGLHSYSHDYDQIYQSVDAFAGDITKLEKFIYKRTGVHAQALRFPGGSSNSIVGDIGPYISWVHKHGYEYYDWNAVSGDALSFQASAETLNQNILNDVNGQSTVIVLMHDLSQQTHTVEALPALIRELRSQGYEFDKIDQNTELIQHIKEE